jgi:hypothetical protein
MAEPRVGGERIELIQEAFRGMKARREADGWVSVTGRLDPVPGEALMRALRVTETELPRRIGSSRDEHRAAALDEIARQVEILVSGASADAVSPTLFDASSDTETSEEIVRAARATDDASADSRVRGRVDRARHPSGLVLVKPPT